MAGGAFSPLARLLATLLLLALSLAAWKWLQRPSPSVAGPAAASAPQSGGRKRRKKKTKTKATPQVEDDNDTSDQVVTTPVQPKSDSEDSDSDSDDGRSAMKQLSTRHFRPAALGGVRNAVNAASTGPKFQAGQRVVARFQGGAEWFPAAVTEVRRGDTYHLQYDDGGVEFHVAGALIRPEGEPYNDQDEEEHGDEVSSPPLAEDEEEEEEEEDDGWEVVGQATKPRKATQAAQETPAAATGLTKRQRESRRKKERQREVKELARRQAREGEFDARARMKYVPPPTQQQP